MAPTTKRKRRLQIEDRSNVRNRHVSVKLTQNEKERLDSVLKDAGLTTSNLIQHVVKLVNTGNLDLIYPVSTRNKA